LFGVRVVVMVVIVMVMTVMTVIVMMRRIVTGFRPCPKMERGQS
jgi:hypothetical protein